MRILHVVPTYLPARRYGGTIFALHALCAALVGVGCNVTVFTTNVDGAGDSAVPIGGPVHIDGVEVWYFRSPVLRRLYVAPGMAKALAEQHLRFDLMHLHSVYLWPTWQAARIARCSNRPYVLSPHGMLVRDLMKRKSTLAKRAWIHLIERRNLERAAAIHVTSALEARELADLGFALPRVIEIPNGVGPAVEVAGATVASSAISEALNCGRPIVLYVGRVNWKKGLDRLIVAMSQLPEAVLLIVGNDDEGATPELEALAKQNGVERQVIFGGAVYGATKEALYRRATVLVLPSYSENFGNVVLEAMREGCPVVTTLEVGAAEIVSANQAGLVVPGEAPSLGLAIRQLLDNDALRAAMGRRGREAVLRDYEWGRSARRMIELYSACLKFPERLEQ